MRNKFTLEAPSLDNADDDNTTMERGTGVANALSSFSRCRVVCVCGSLCLYSSLFIVFFVVFSGRRQHDNGTGHGRCERTAIV
jgi:hypothetical protein